MAVTLKEIPESPTFDVSAQGVRLNRTFFARGTDDETTLYTAILAETEAVYDNLIRTGIRTPVHKGGGYWVVEVEYGDPSGNGASGGAGSGGTPVGETPVAPTEIPDGTTALNPATQGLEFTFDISTETKHITQSLETIAMVGLNGTTPKNFNGAIGVSADGSVAGCDVFTPKSDFTITVQRASVTLNYFRLCRDAAAKTNNASWGGFDEGEVLYHGCNGQGTKRGQWTMNHRFSANENLTGVVVFAYKSWAATHAYNLGDEATNDGGKLYVVKTAGLSAGSGGPTGTGTAITDGTVVWDYVSDGTGITLPSVRGWEYVWTSYSPSPVDGLSRPIAAYVEKVYRSTDLADLEVGF